MEILIIENDFTFANQLYKDLFNYFSHISDKNTFDIIMQESSSFKKTKNYDICFLDINLKETNGIEVAKQIKKNGICSIIIFITAHCNLVYDTLLVQPFFFIRKTYYQKDLNNFFKLLESSFKKDIFIPLKWKDTNIVIKIEDILYIEAINHSIIIHTTKGNFNDSRSLKKFIENLDKTYFIQIHKAFVINLKHLISYKTNEVLLTKNISLNIGRKYKEHFLNSFQEYLVR